MTCSATYALALRMTERWADKTLKPFLVSSSAVQLAWTQKGAHGSDRAVSGRFSGTARPPPHGFACRCAAKSSVWHISTNFGLVSRRRLKRNPRSCSAASWEYGIRAGLACQTGDFAARRHSEIVRRPGSTANPLIGPAALPCAPGFASESGRGTALEPALEFNSLRKLPARELVFRQLCYND